MEPLVTVIVTVFKRVEFIREAIESVLAQTFESYEIIVTDDADSEAAKLFANQLVDQIEFVIGLTSGDLV